MKEKLYIFLVCLFCNIFVIGNLIFKKFVSIDFFGMHLNVSVGILLFPITFLISDLVTEFYRKAKAFSMINISIIITLLNIIIIYVANIMNATSWSEVDNITFNLVFGSFGVAVLSSLVANYLSQNCDIVIYDFIKKLTNGKYIWVRNNVSTIIAQILDSFCVTTIMLIFGTIPDEQYFVLAFSSLKFKVDSTMLAAPFFYLAYRIIIKIK
jgi:uncharacterized integral membrane protein (TIGR00697 family)